MGNGSRRMIGLVSLVVALTMIVPGVFLDRAPVAVAAQDSGNEATVTIEDFDFNEDRIDIPVGTTVVWTNSGDAPHTVTADDESFGSDTLSNGDTFSFTFNDAGEFAYHCAIHPRMTGLIVVTEAADTGDAEAVATEEPSATEEPTEEATAEAPSSDATLVGGAINGSNALEYAGDIQVRDDDVTIFGYLTKIAGVDTASLFTDDDPENWGEETARFTFFGSGSIDAETSSGDSVDQIDATVETTFFVNRNGGGSFDNAESFLSGAEIAKADMTLHYVTTDIDDETAVVDGDAALVWTSNSPFDLNDTTLQLGKTDGRHRLTYSGLAEVDDDQVTISLAGSSITIAAPATTTDAATPTATSTEPAASSDEITIDLNELNDSGMSGSATLQADGDQTIVTVTLDGAVGGHPTHIHNGTCNDLDPNPAFPLNDVDDAGNSETTVDVALSDLLSEPFALNIHQSVDEIGVYVACGNIETNS